jgi:hypothetical protein
VSPGRASERRRCIAPGARELASPVGLADNGGTPCHRSARGVLHDPPRMTLTPRGLDDQCVAVSPLCVQLCRQAHSTVPALRSAWPGCLPAPVHGHGRTVRLSDSMPLLSAARSVPAAGLAPIRMARAGPGAYPGAGAGTCAGIGAGTQRKPPCSPLQKAAFAPLKNGQPGGARCQNV